MMLHHAAKWQFTGWLTTALVVLLLTGACGVSSDTTQSPTTVASVSTPDIFFPQQQRLGDTPQALIQGVLVKDGKGCLRVKSPDGSLVPVWPPGFKLRTENGEIQILDRKDRLKAKVGEQVLMRGWQASEPSDLSMLDKQTRRELRNRCSGPYWIADPQVRMPRREATT